MIYLPVEEVIRLQQLVIARSGGGTGILEVGKIESAVAQPRMTFGGVELYPTVVEKAAALGFSLACNHGFVDGNKRIGHAAMETFLVLNGHELTSGVDEQEDMFLRLADHKVGRDEFTEWVRRYVAPISEV